MFETIEDRFATFANELNLLETVGLIFLLLTAAETIWDLISKRRKSYKETLANVSIAVVANLLDRTLYGLIFLVGLFAAEQFAVASIPVTGWSFVLALIAADLSYYWMHRFEHEIRFFWAHHVVHHSSPEYNLTTALRLSWTESLFEWIFLVPMVLIGFDAVQTLVAFLAVVTYQTWIHTEKVGKLGWLDGIFNTPSVHRVHHGSNEKYIDKNYGGVLIIWDRLFGTYQTEQEPVTYGIIKPINSANPFTIVFHEYWQIIRDVMVAQKLKNKLGFIFGRPGWQPSKKTEKSGSHYTPDVTET